MQRSTFKFNDYYVNILALLSIYIFPSFINVKATKACGFILPTTTSCILTSLSNKSAHGIIVVGKAYSIQIPDGDTLDEIFYDETYLCFFRVFVIMIV